MIFERATREWATSPTIQIDAPFDPAEADSLSFLSSSECQNSAPQQRSLLD